MDVTFGRRIIMITISAIQKIGEVSIIKSVIKSSKENIRATGKMA
ncbi:hypothetical protein FM107_17565 [Sphingobacterium sp. JB170]|nr:hypothetical protein FM107_17565 [Sphingobacterium sp. JB170]